MADRLRVTQVHSDTFSRNGRRWLRSTYEIDAPSERAASWRAKRLESNQTIIGGEPLKARDVKVVEVEKMEDEIFRKEINEVVDFDGKVLKEAGRFLDKLPKPLENEEEESLIAFHRYRVVVERPLE